MSTFASNEIARMALYNDVNAFVVIAYLSRGLYNVIFSLERWLHVINLYY